jgi:glycosyltransferase involved in cell wall biosynthesis
VQADLSIVMPVYNEAAVIEGVVTDLLETVCDRLYRAELVVVDDGSSDETPGILDRLAASDSRVKVHHAERNRGHGPTLRTGFERAEGQWIFQLDSDGQQLAAEFWDLWARRADADLVMGMRQISRNGRHRVIVSAFARYANRVLGGGNIRDVNVPFKLFRREVWQDLRDDIPQQPVAPSLLLAVGAAFRGWRIEQVAVSCRPRTHGPSTVNLRALARLSAGAARELVAYRARLARRARDEGRAEVRVLSPAP